ncbi:MAG: hypothetical protein ACE5IW_10245 [bacterium]
MPSKNNNADNDNGKIKSSDKKNNDKNSKKLAEASPPTKFIGFHRKGTGFAWNYLPYLLASEESVTAKAKFLYGEGEIHIINVDLPK